MDTKTKLKVLADIHSRVLTEIPELTYIGDGILREKTTDVDFQDGVDIGNKLKLALEKYRNISGLGRGLAAPQIGINKSVFVTFVDNNFKIYINPKITKSSSNFNLYRESCLSCGFLSVDVKRPTAVEIEYINDQGLTIKESADSFLARLIQHEQDHLLGIVNIDKAELASIEFRLNDPLKEKLRDVGI